MNDILTVVVVVVLVFGPTAFWLFMERRLASADTRRMADTPKSESVRSTGGAARSEAKGDAKP